MEDEHIPRDSPPIKLPDMQPSKHQPNNYQVQQATDSIKDLGAQQSTSDYHNYIPPIDTITEPTATKKRSSSKKKRKVEDIQNLTIPILESSDISEKNVSIHFNNQHAHQIKVWNSIFLILPTPQIFIQIHKISSQPL